MMKIKNLEEQLQTLCTFEEPNILLEQYSTSPHIASRVLYVAQTQFSDIKNKCVADLGTGCGILSLGASILGASYVVGLDIDLNALKTLNENRKVVKTPVEALCCDVMSFLPGKYKNFFDTVVMNPPFGTKHNKGTDLRFLEVASQISNNAIYSLYKTSTRSYILRKAEKLGLKSQVIAELSYDIPPTYKFHKKKSINVAVDLTRFVIKK